MLRNEITGLTKEIVNKRPPADNVPIHRPLVQIANAISAFLDTRQFDKLGRAAGHATRGCVSLVPAYLQARTSSHPTIAVMQFPAIQLTRTGARDAVRQFAFVHDAIFMAIALNRVLPPDDIKVSARHYSLSYALSSSYDLLFHYGRAGASHIHGVLDTELVAWNDELHSFVNAEDIGGDERINASLEHEIRYGTDGAANIQGVIDSDSPKHKRLNGCGPIRRSSSKTICMRHTVRNTATLATMPESWC